MEEVAKMLPRYEVPVVEKKTRGKRKKTHEEYVEELKLKNPTVEVIGKYVGTKTKIEHHCLTHDVYWNTSPTCALQGSGCYKCHSERLGVKKSKTTEEYIDELSINNPTVIPVEDYIDANTKIMHRCLIHDIYWEATPNNALRGSGCEICHKERLGNSKKMTHMQYIDKVSKINPYIIVVGEYLGSSVPISHRCIIDNYEWFARPCNILLGCGCPKCAGNIKKTQEEYIEELRIKNPNTEVVGQYIDSKTKIQHRCKIHNEKWLMSPVNALKGSECKYCHSEKCSIIFTKSHEGYVKELGEINPDLTVLERYNGVKTPILHRCVNGHEIKISPTHALGGRGCKLCNKEKNKILRQLTNDEYLQRLISINSTVRPLEKYNGITNKILHTDIICKHKWMADPAHILKGTGCPFCKASLGERILNVILINNSISYIKNHTYDDLIGIGGRLLSYDFYLPQYNLLIEFQGEQHERPVDYFGGIKSFIKQKIHDTRKRKYCHDNNINFLEIWYYEINKIEQILKQYLNNLKLESVETTGVA